MSRYYKRRYKNNSKLISLALCGIIYIMCLPIILLILIIKTIIKYKNKRKSKIVLLSEKNTYNTTTNDDYKQSNYHIKNKTITNNEQYFLDIIKKHFSSNYEIRFQVPLSSVIEKDKRFPNEYQNELNRVIDIGIFNKETSYPLLLIEINDSTHLRKDRQVRDAKVKNICKQANLKLIAFWTEYSNTEQYVVEKINKHLS